MNTLNFLDANVWLALLWGRHIHSERAREWLERSPEEKFFRKSNGEWIELLRLQSDEQVAGDPVLVGNWFFVSTTSKARTRILLYQVVKANLPVVRLSVEIEGPAKASVRLDSSNLVIADDFGRLQVFELTYGERIRDIRQ